MMEKKLNDLLANYQVMLHKLQTYHWYVKGRTFFPDHAQLELYYEQASANVDIIAEHILMLGGKPLARMKDVLDAATIKEATDKTVEQEQAFKGTRADFETLLEGAIDIKRTAEEEENFLISVMIDDIISQLYKDLWMLGQSLER